MDASCAARPSAEPGMSNSTQWVTGLSEASASSMMRTKLLVSGGVWLHCRAGEVPAPSHVWIAEIELPCTKSGHVKVNPISAIASSPRFRSMYFLSSPEQNWCHTHAVAWGVGGRDAVSAGSLLRLA